jgi:hypothetical protein
MNFTDINANIEEAALAGSDGFLNKYLQYENQIVNNLSSFDGLQSEIYLHNYENEFEQIKYASIFTDFLSIYTGPGDKSEYHMTFFDEGHAHFVKERKVTIPATLAKEINPNAQEIKAGYIYPSHKDIKNLIETYGPLFRHSKSVLRPVRALLVDSGNPTARQGTIYYAQGNTIHDHWVLRDSISHDSLPIANYLNSEQSKVVFRLTLPYFKNATLDQLITIVTQESDLLSVLRKELKNIVIDFDKKETNIDEIRQDILRPEMDKINRHFKHYKNLHRWRIAGSCGFFSLSLIKVFVPDGDISSFIHTLVTGAGFSGILLSEWDYQTKMNSLRDNPYFLLWKIQRQPKLEV